MSLVKLEAESVQCTRAVLGGEKRPTTAPQSEVWPPNPVSNGYISAMFVLVTSLCLAFSDVDIEFDFVLMTSGYSQYLKDSCKRHLTLIGS